MTRPDSDTFIATVEELEALYGTPSPTSLTKVAPRLTPQYRRLIEASPFLALATRGPEGLDCSPRGDAGQVLHVEDETTVMLPDRHGNNRIDSLRNIVIDPEVALLCLIPGSGTCIRINGRARISAEPALLERFAMQGKAPRSMIVVAIREVYFQCARAVLRAGLWDAARHIDPKSLPTPGEVLAQIDSGFDGQEYDRVWPEHATRSMW